MIDLAQLPPDGLRLEGNLGSLALGDGSALRQVAWRMLAMPSGSDFFMEVKGHAIWEGSCSRCLEPLDLPLAVESQFLGSKDPDLVVRGSHSLGSQDLDVVFFPEPALDEETLVREQFLLQAPMHPLCREDCEGLCPSCGKNWNKGRCSCRLEYQKEPGALAKALVGLKLNLPDAGTGTGGSPSSGAGGS
jgi:uncharacterized protein